MVDYGELKQRLVDLAGRCSGLHFDTRYLPDTREIDEPYKARRTLMRLEDIDHAIDLARQLEAAVQVIVMSINQVVKAPEDLEWEAEQRSGEGGISSERGDSNP